MNKKLSQLFTMDMTVCFVLSALLCAASFFMGYPLVSLAEFLLLAGVFVWYQLRNIRRKKNLAQYFQDVNFSLDAVSGEQMNVPVPAVIMNLRDGEITWSNEAFLQIVGETESVFGACIATYFPEVSIKWLLDGRTECPDELVRGDSRYRVYGDMIRSSDENSGYQIAMLYFVDLSELLALRDEFNLSRPVVSLILVDNYDELTSNLSDKSVSGFSAALDDAITAWTAETGGILRRLQRNRYLFIFEARELPKFIEAKFSVLDNVRAIKEYGIPATVSIGVGKDGQTLQESYEFASLSIEMALARGGDQAVVKDRYNFSFYGGRSKEAERQTKVRSRVMAGSLQELISGSETVYIMGHKNADLDAVGAAVGVMAICRKLGKPAKIVLDQSFNASEALLEKLMEVPTYQVAFISPTTALESFTEDNLLVIVDTNRPDQVETRALLEYATHVAVIDHHRRAADYIDDALLNFHEPYASSASELVTELIQYLLEREDLLPVETLALLAGIVLDTKNFSVRTGSRTFEAAAWLRKNGADTVAVKLLFQNDLKATLSRYEIIQHAELYRNNIALCCLDYTSDRITAAQAADELLNISGIQASFVFYPDGNQVICSARSIGEANVQMILEPLGGGGNQATAGAQIRGFTPEQVRSALKNSIDEFFAD